MVEAPPDGGGSGVGIDSDYWNWHTELSDKLQRFYDKFMEAPDPPGPEGVPPGQKEAYADLSPYVERFRNATATEQFYDLLAPNKSIFTELESINPKITSTDAYKNSAAQRNHPTLTVGEALNNARGRLSGWEGTTKDTFGNEWLPDVEDSLYEFAAVQAGLAACAELYRDLVKKTRQDVLSVLEIAIEGRPVSGREKAGLVLTSVGFLLGVGSTLGTGGLSGTAMSAVLG